MSNTKLQKIGQGTGVVIASVINASIVAGTATKAGLKAAHKETKEGSKAFSAGFLAGFLQTRMGFEAKRSGVVLPTTGNKEPQAPQKPEGAI